MVVKKIAELIHWEETNALNIHTCSHTHKSTHSCREAVHVDTHTDNRHAITRIFSLMHKHTHTQIHTPMQPLCGL